MNIWLEIYLGVAILMAIISHGFASNPNCSKGNAHSISWGIILWPAVALIDLVKSIFNFRW